MRWSVAAVAIGALALHAWSYLPFIADDALISLRYARRLLDGHGLTWTDGEVVEGYSNLLWVLLSAGLGAVGVDLIDAVRVLGFGSAAAAIIAVTSTHRPASASDALPAFFGGLAIAGSGTIAIWTVGGLEQPLVAGLLAWALVRSLPLVESESSRARGALVVPGLLFGLLAWTRPDGPLFAAATCGGLLLARRFERRAWRDAALLISIPALFVFAQLVFRLAYYGEWVPNSTHTKLHFTGQRLLDGLAYLGSGLLMLGGLSLPGLAVAAAAPWSKGAGSAGRRARLLVVPLVAWSAYVAVIGGDIFPGRRHMAPVVVLLALLAAEGFAIVRSRKPERTPLAWGLALVLLAGLVVAQRCDARNELGETHCWAWDGQVVGDLLKTAFVEEQPLLAVDASGTLPYFSRLPSIDMLGLNDRWIATHPPPDIGHGWIGHELGDGNYVLEREPDLVLFSTPGHSPPSGFLTQKIAGRVPPRFKSGAEMFRDPRFKERYTLTLFEGVEPYTFRSGIFVRREGGRIGILRQKARVVVPGYLLNVIPGSIARLDDERRIGMSVVPDVSAGIRYLPLDPGRWRMHVEFSGGPVLSRVTRWGTEDELVRGEDVLEFALDAGTRGVDILLAVRTGNMAHVRRVALRRVE